MKIPLSGKLGKGKYAIVDEEFEYLKKYKWYLNNNKYAIRYIYSGINKRKSIFMHNEILPKKPKEYTDHISGDGLDNRLSNLRLCTQSQNMFNIGKHKDNKSGFKGVHFHKGTSKWRSQITIPGKGNKHIGLFLSKEEAYKAYVEASKKYHGEFAGVKL